MDARSLDSWTSSYRTPEHADSIRPREVHDPPGGLPQRFDGPLQREPAGDALAVQQAGERERARPREGDMAQSGRVASCQGRRRGAVREPAPQDAVLLVQDHDARVVDDAVAFLLETPDEVDVLAVAELLVEADRRTHDQRRARHIRDGAVRPEVERRPPPVGGPDARRDRLD